MAPDRRRNSSLRHAQRPQDVKTEPGQRLEFTAAAYAGQVAWTALPSRDIMQTWHSLLLAVCASLRANKSSATVHDNETA